MIRLAALTTALMFPLLSQAEPGQDAGDQRSIDNWGQVVDPEGDCGFETLGESLIIKLPGSVKRLNSEMGQMEAPRVLQPINGEVAVQVAVNGSLSHPNPDAGLRSYVSGGLVLMQDDRNYVRLERATFTRSGNIWHYINFERRVAGRPSRMGRFNDYPIAGDETVQLRMELREGSLRALVQRSEGPWHEIGSVELNQLPTSRAGVAALNTSGYPCEVPFENFTVQNDFEPIEASPGAIIDLSVQTNPGLAR